MHSEQKQREPSAKGRMSEVTYATRLYQDKGGEQRHSFIAKKVQEKVSEFSIREKSPNQRMIA